MAGTAAAHEGGLTAGLPLEDERCSPRLRGGNGAGGGKIREDLYGLPDPWNAPFRKMIAHPEVHRRVSQRHLPPYFPGHFAPVLRRLFAVVLRFPASWRQDGENGRKMA